MPYEIPFLRLVVSGTLYAVEDFSFGMSLILANGAPGSGAPDEVPQAIVDAVLDLFGEPIMSAGAQVTTVKLNLIGEDGKYVNDDTVLHEFPPASAAGSAVGVPPQVAYCVSLETASRRGRAHAGRFYLPVPSRAVGLTTGVLSNNDRDMYRESVDPFLAAVNGAVPNYELGVTSNLGSGTQRRVTNARYGRVYDTIRSRREKFPEEYIDGAALPASTP